MFAVVLQYIGLVNDKARDSTDVNLTESGEIISFVLCQICICDETGKMC